jgi:hypothetical protein
LLECFPQAQKATSLQLLEREPKSFSLLGFQADVTVNPFWSQASVPPVMLLTFW